MFGKWVFPNGPPASRPARLPRGRRQKQKQKHESAARRCGKQKHAENQISRPAALNQVLHTFSRAPASALGEKKRHNRLRGWRRAKEGRFKIEIKLSFLSFLERML